MALLNIFDKFRGKRFSRPDLLIANETFAELVSLQD